MKLTSVGKSAYFKGDGGSFLRLLFTLHCLLLVSVASLSWSPGGARNAQCYQNLLILFGHVFLNSSHFGLCHRNFLSCSMEHIDNYADATEIVKQVCP